MRATEHSASSGEGHSEAPLGEAPRAVSDPVVCCDTCDAACCRLEVLCLTETDIPRRFTRRDAWGGITMDRLDDGWCAALDRDTLLCRIYEQRPLVCREFEMGGPDCLDERNREHGPDVSQA